MKSILYLLIALAFQAPCYAEVTDLSAEHRKILRDASGFRQLYKAADLPASIVVLCADHKGRLADPGQNWQVTDIIIDESFADRRLIWAAVNGEFYVVHYEAGGRGHSYHILLAKFKEGDSAKLLWHEAAGRFKDFNAFLDSLNAGKEIIFPSWGNGAPEIALTVKGDWNQKTNKGPDFDIHHLTPDIGVDSITIYVGHNPQDSVGADATATKINVGKSPVVFYVTRRDGIFHAEAVIEGFFSGLKGPGVSELKLHIMINAANSERLADLFKYIETLKPIEP